MDHRSPLESIFNIIGGLPQGHDKPIKHALYNAVALFLLFICAAVCWALYMILEPFIKPLMWAVLVGSALHPLKRSLRYRFQNWFESLEATHTPAVIGLILLPVNIFNELSEFIGQILLNRLKLIIACGVAVPVIIVLYHYTPNLIISLVWNVVVYSYKSLNFVLDNSSIPLVLVVLLGYISLVFLAWKPENNTKFHYASTVMWLFVSGCVAQLFGSFQVPMFLLMQVVFFGGFISEVYEIYREVNASGQTVSFTEALYYAFHEKPVDFDNSEEAIGASDDNGTSEMIKTNADTSPKPKSCVKFSKDENIENIGDGSSSTKLLNDDAEKDPFSLDLFDDKSTKLPENTSDLNNTGVLITNQGIHLIQPQEILSNKSIPKSKPKFQRSLSQPQFYHNGRFKRANLWGKNRRLYVRKSSLDFSDAQGYGSTFYLYSVLWACVFMLFWKNTILLPLLPLPILFYILKHMGTYFGIWSYLYEKFCLVFEMVTYWCSARHDALVPVPIRGLYKVIHKINNVVKSSIKDSIDTVASCVVILGLIILLICGSIFIILQIYAEAIMLVQMTGNVINQTVVHNPELRQMLPPTWDNTMESILDNAYQYGREGISKAVKSVMTDVDSIKSEKLEKQVLELWDRIYQSWMSTDDGNGPKVTQDAVKSSWEAFIKDIQRSPEMFNINGIIEFGKQNVGTLMSLLESIWSIVMSNISIILGSFGTFLSVILGGGTAVLNFILNVVVFLTTLFYLLNSSGDLYKPVELLTHFSSGGQRLGHALEGAINGVFTASFKMAAFYGLWTWFIHNLFNVKIVYLPSAFATILGAVPFLGTYWACLPAVLDLWLAQDRWIAGVLFATFQFLPTSVVDTTIYKEIKGGHPYLTGLAIAGGIFCLGVEGAIIGPLLLCGLYVATDLSQSFFKESPSDESINLRLHQLQDSS